MVLKKRKPGACKVNTGRTIRNGPHHSSRNRYAFVKYTKDGPVEVAIRGEEQLKDVFAVLPSEDVEYSLKKKGRWKIGDVIKKQVMPQIQDARYEVQLCEHYHKLGCKDPCTGGVPEDIGSRNVMLAHDLYSGSRWERAAAPHGRVHDERALVEERAPGVWVPSGWLSFNIVHGVRDDSSAAFVKQHGIVKQGKKSKERSVGKRDALDEALCDYYDSFAPPEEEDDLPRSSEAPKSRPSPKAVAKVPVIRKKGGKRPTKAANKRIHYPK